jgi:GT2 family glycosyltransferase
MHQPSEALASAAPVGPPGHVGCVVIGRNEGTRLRECLASVSSQCASVVYVDSGSADDSVAVARAAGVPVLELDASIPFSAARARNEGFVLLRRIAPATTWVQFVDGDCRLEPGWFAIGTRALQADATLGVVFGRSRERSPERSIYNLLCDIELDVPPGSARACGGVAMVRAEAFEQAGGFDERLIAGEEPELCLRLRRLAWRIECLPAPMMRHDVAMRSFRQWWRRSVRTGHAYAESAWKHGSGRERYRVREVARTVWWGAGLPALVTAACWAFGLVALVGLSAYGWPWARAYAHVAGRRDRRCCFVYASFCTLAKLPELAGVLRFCCRRLVGGQPRIIEHK